METIELTRSEVEKLADDSEDEYYTTRTVDGEKYAFHQYMNPFGADIDCQNVPNSTTWDELLTGEQSEKTWPVYPNICVVMAEDEQPLFTDDELLEMFVQLEGKVRHAVMTELHERGYHVEREYVAHKDGETQIIS